MNFLAQEMKELPNNLQHLTLNLSSNNLGRNSQNI